MVTLALSTHHAYYSSMEFLSKDEAMRLIDDQAVTNEVMIRLDTSRGKRYELEQYRQLRDMSAAMRQQFDNCQSNAALAAYGEQEFEAAYSATYESSLLALLVAETAAEVHDIARSDLLYRLTQKPGYEIEVAADTAADLYRSLGRQISVIGEYEFSRLSASLQSVLGAYAVDTPTNYKIEQMKIGYGFVLQPLLVTLSEILTESAFDTSQVDNEMIALIEAQE